MYKDLRALLDTFQSKTKSQLKPYKLSSIFLYIKLTIFSIPDLLASYKQLKFSLTNPDTLIPL